jgi:histone deacetylase 6
MIGDNDYIFVCESLFFPIIREFAPDLIIVSAGFDSAKGDPIGEITLSPLAYAYMTKGLRQIQPKLAVVLEGGYSLEALEVSSEAVIRTLKLNPDDQEGYSKLLRDLGAAEEIDSFEK